MCLCHFQFFKEANETYSKLQKQDGVIRSKFACDKNTSLDNLTELLKALEVSFDNVASWQYILACRCEAQDILRQCVLFNDLGVNSLHILVRQVSSPEQKECECECTLTMEFE